MKLFKITLLLLLPCILFAQETVSETYVLNKDVVWASPGGNDLHMDIYGATESEDPKPVLVIFHGGGWLINTKSIMNQMSDYVANTGNYVVCNVDYRLLTAEENTVTMDEIVEDAMGAVLWIKEHIAGYGGDPSKIAVTGDSAGGQMAAMVTNGREWIGSCEVSTQGLCYTPTYMPQGMSADSREIKEMMDVQAAILSYPAVDLYAACFGDGQGNGFESPSNFFWEMGGAEGRGIFGADINPIDHPKPYQLVSPAYTIPDAKTRMLPPTFCHVGSRDNTTPPESIQAYADALQKAGHPVEIKIYPDKPHAYLDSGSNEYLGITFEKDAIAPLDDIIRFLDAVFY